MPSQAIRPRRASICNARWKTYRASEAVVLELATLEQHPFLSTRAWPSDERRIQGKRKARGDVSTTKGGRKNEQKGEGEDLKRCQEKEAKLKRQEAGSVRMPSSGALKEVERGKRRRGWV
eukprot:1569829-Rhodomonas_salina.1